jgi:hypothetical protein
MEQMSGIRDLVQNQTWIRYLAAQLESSGIEKQTQVFSLMLPPTM